MLAKTMVQSSGSLRVLGEAFRTVSSWWLRELQLLFPSVRLGSSHDKQSSLLIRCEQDRLSCHLNLGGSEQRTEYRVQLFDEARLDRWLAGLGTTRERTRVGFVLDEALFFVRDLELPRAALHALPQILDQDLARRTPFESQSVWHGGVERSRQGDGSAAVVEVRHWIVGKERVNAALRDANVSESAVDFLVVAGELGDQLANISMRQPMAPVALWVPRAIQLLTVLAIMALAVGLGLISSVQSRTASRVDEELAAARQSMGVANSGGVSRFILQRSEASVAAIWDELSRILPDDTYLGDLRIAEGKVLLSGFSADAPKLVRLIGESRLFDQVSLVGAIAPKAGEGKDQFKLSAVVKRGRIGPRSNASNQKTGF